ncbi:DUF3298 and DUF4163 domain-containing protein [Sedimentibacter sp. MB31-C6]|uniref:DUF3298 and DUF4163 domain-containing protein n=1 Tax=Sedimentibacter sp. MB31-C6 TaxID=3109366 RepID=UPI002DDDAE7F|nr:DUF3298 and DUF4163 domain-containing protein [Sedimentibacter sp. MB36-C1]WSI03224.1 DUF3298 and DUF4163 domain-containing protein [Sedimentibacter sp. MB36-C1]
MKKNCYNSNIYIQQYERTYKYNDIDVLVLSIKYPIITIKNNKMSEWLINNQIAMIVNDYMRYVYYLYYQAIRFYYESQENNFPFNSFSAYMEYTITYNENCFLSSYVDKYEFTGGAHGSTDRSSYTWDLCSGKQIFFNDIFKLETDYRLLLTDELIRQANYNIQQNPGIYFEDYKGLIIRNFNPHSFYLTRQGLTIYYQQYEIAPYSTGIVEFTVPYNTIGWYPRCYK